MKKWSAEIFFPYTLFYPLDNTPPKQNTYWRANFYRLDYDSEKMAKSAWIPFWEPFMNLKNLAI